MIKADIVNKVAETSDISRVKAAQVPGAASASFCPDLNAPRA